MKKLAQKIKHRSQSKGQLVFFAFFLMILSFLSACSELENPKTEPYYAETSPPPKQEFRWSNGKTPKSFDPALAAAPPETDVARAIYEGLTDTNPKNLEPIPAIALKWKSEDDHKTWTFELRRDAKWSNGEAVKAEDFVRSWKRLSEMGSEVSHRDLLSNIVGMEFKPVDAHQSDTQKSGEELNKEVKQTGSNLSQTVPVSGTKPSQNLQKTVAASSVEQPLDNKNSGPKTDKPKPETETFGVEAVEEYKLKVLLNKSDKDFPALVGHPLFRPVYPESNFEKLNPDIVTNGAFRVSSVGADGVTLDRAEFYWNKESVKLERVRFVPKENAEQALAAYRSGEIDAVTNAEFEPLALKLLMPYDDFKRTVHSALNFYEINKRNKPFDDKRVREALAISIERERLTDDEMDGSTKPALGFQPYAVPNKAKLIQDLEKGKTLLAGAGFANGENFPKIRLLINRNDTQQRIARLVAKMWKQNLNLETEILVKEPGELEAAIQAGEYDIVRRGVVLPTSDETVNMLALFAQEKSKESQQAEQKSSESFSENKQSKKAIESSVPVDAPKMQKPAINSADAVTKAEVTEDSGDGRLILTEDQAIDELLAIPLYFPTSYSLVKPYVLGFEIDTFDATSLNDVSIDSYWQPKDNLNES